MNYSHQVYYCITVQYKNNVMNKSNIRQKRAIMQHSVGARVPCIGSLYLFSIY